MGDSMVVLTTRGGLPLAKTWRVDGTIQGYGRMAEDGGTVGAKHYTLEVRDLGCLDDLARDLETLRGFSDCCVIRGEHNGHPLDKGRVLRRKAWFRDAPHHWVMFDVDGFQPGLADLSDPESAFAEWVVASLPPAFWSASFIWHLSGSHGHPDKPGLRGHVWFWLERAYDSDTLAAWVTSSGLQDRIDRSVLDSVQVHYTADPLFEAGVVDPIPQRMGLRRGDCDQVDLVLDEDAIAQALLARGSRGEDGEDGARFRDPRLKSGPIGAFCRLYRVADVLTADWFEPAGEFEQVTEARWTWLGGNGAAEGVRIDETGLVNTHNTAPGDSHKTRLNAFDLLRVYQFGHLDEPIRAGGDGWTIEAEPWTAPSYRAALAFVKALPGVREEVEREQASRGLEVDSEDAQDSDQGWGEAAGSEPERPASEVGAGIVRGVGDQATPLDPTEGWAVEMLDRCLGGLRAVGATRDEADSVVMRSHVAACWRGVFYSAGKSKLYLINRAGALASFARPEWRKMITATFGDLWDRAALDAAAGRIHADQDDAGKWVVAAEKSLWGLLEKYVMLYRQRESMAFEVDPFADRDRMEIQPESVLIRFRHLPFQRKALPVEVDESEIVAEIRQHLPWFDDLLGLVLHARFAADRRKAFLWLKLASSMGKGFLFQGVLGVDGLGLVAPVSVAEIERALEGAPLGLDAAMLYRAWILWVDEFKAGKSELKQLNNDLWVTPKNQLRARVPTYLKVFTSAEGVDSLAGSEGVEQQFAERFSFLARAGDALRLDDRPVFKDVGRLVYRTVLSNHAADMLNAGVERMRSLGRVEASRRADAWLDAWHAAHGIGNSFASLEHSLAGYAEEILDLVRDYARDSTRLRDLPGQMRAALSASVEVVAGSKSAKACKRGEIETLAVVRRVTSLVKAWVAYAIEPSQRVLVGHKAHAIAEVMVELCGQSSSIVDVYRYHDDPEKIVRVTAKGLCLTVSTVDEMAQALGAFESVST